LSPESAEARSLFKAPREDGPGSSRNWIAVNAVQQSILNKKLKTKTDNSTPKKFSFPHTPMKRSLNILAALVAISLWRQTSAAIFNI
jgi:hypothetical protein